MKRKNKAKDKIKKRNCTPEECEHCLYIGAGDFVCDLGDSYYKVVVEDFQPTENYLQCKKQS